MGEKTTPHSKPPLGYIFIACISVTLLTLATFIVTSIIWEPGWVIVVGSSIAVMTVFTLIFTIIFSKIFKDPTEHIRHELVALNEKVNASHIALSAVNENSKSLMENLPGGFLAFNSKNELTKINALAAKMLGFTETDAVNAETVWERLKQARSHVGANFNLTDWINKVKPEKIQAVHAWPMVLFTEGETPTACDVLAHYNKYEQSDYELVILFVDRSKEYERQEKQMEFISLAAHELRGPITVIRGLIDIFQDEIGETLSAEHQELLTRMATSARQLAGYVDNILNVSRVDKESFEIHQRETNWSSVLTQATNDLAIRAKAHHRSIEVHVPQDLPTVAADPIAIQHVIQNLVDNAIKYSQDGGKIIVSARQKDDTIETTVQDFGIGIPANVVENLFTKFYRSHRSKKIVGGTGLGLYLCKVIVDTHGGTIWVRSTEGAGTTFGFTLPTYSSVADKLKNGDNNEESGIIRGSHGWIKNHALYRR